MRMAAYGCVSSVLAIGVILSAMYQRSNFYAACIYLSKSSACMMILLNMGLIISVLFGKALQTVFFGRLRAIEVEHLYERSWYAVTETCLAMTIFREEFDLQFIVVFTTLLFLKIFHWLCQDRVEFMEQSPTNRVVFHVRMVNLLALLLLIDGLLANHAINVTMTKGPNMMIMFGFEYTILICSILSIIGKYILNIIDMRSEETWEGKSMYVFYLDLATDFFKLVTYLVFFMYICLNYQLPFHIIRDVYVTFRSFIQKCRDLYRYRRATRNMNELYPNATQEDLTRSSDSTCIICREEMHIIDPNMEEENAEPAAYRTDNENSLDQPKKLPCGHIFHFHCLRSWLERQQTCPTCRRSVLVQNNTPTSDNQQPQPQPQPQPQQQDLNQVQQQQLEEFQQLLQGHDPTRNNTQERPANNTSLNILTPSNQPTPTHMNIPGLIPLIPLNQQQQQVSGLPLEITDEDLRVLSTLTRESMEQRLRVLQTVQDQIFQTMQTLAQVLSVLPSSASNSREEPQDQPGLSSSAEAPSTEAPSTEVAREEDDGLSDRQRQKLPNYTATTISEQVDEDDEEEDL